MKGNKFTEEKEFTKKNKEIDIFLSLFSGPERSKIFGPDDLPEPCQQPSTKAKEAFQKAKEAGFKISPPTLVFTWDAYGNEVIIDKKTGECLWISTKSKTMGINQQYEQSCSQEMEETREEEHLHTRRGLPASVPEPMKTIPYWESPLPQTQGKVVVTKSNDDFYSILMELPKEYKQATVILSGRKITGEKYEETKMVQHQTHACSFRNIPPGNYSISLQTQGKQPFQLFSSCLSQKKTDS